MVMKAQTMVNIEVDQEFPRYDQKSALKNGKKC